MTKDEKSRCQHLRKLFGNKNFWVCGLNNRMIGLIATEDNKPDKPDWCPLNDQKQGALNYNVSFIFFE